MRPDDAPPDDQRLVRASGIVRALSSDRVGLTRLDELVRSAALTAWAPVALVSMITDRQVTASAQRVGGSGPTPARGEHASLDDSVCVHALRSNGPVRVSDARHDDRVARIPATVDGVLGSYLGVPLRLDGGDLVGVLCVYDSAPRSWSEADEHDLDELATQVAAELVRITDEYERVVSPDAGMPARR